MWFEHFSGIRQLQSILLKVALLLGVRIFEGVGFEELVPPPDDQTESKFFLCNLYSIIVWRDSLNRRLNIFLFSLLALCIINYSGEIFSVVWHYFMLFLSNV